MRIEEQQAKAALERVLAHQTEVTEGERKVAYLHGVIEQQQRAISEANSFTTNVPELLTKRETLLADIVLGFGAQEDLHSLDLQISAAKEELDQNTTRSASIASNAKQTIAGLQKKLQAAKEELAALQTQTPSITDSFLMAEAERVGTEYIEAIQVVADCHKQLMALNDVMIRFRNHDRKRGIVGYHNELALPLFNLDSHKKYDHPQNPEYRLLRVFLNRQQDAKYAAAAAERERIKALGVATNLEPRWTGTGW